MSLARNTLLYMPAQVIGPLAQFAATVAWTHYVAPSAFGIVTFVIAAQDMTSVLGIVWWSMFVVRFQSRYAGDEDVKFRSMDSRMVAVAALFQALLSVPALAAIGAPLSPGLVAATFAFLATRTLTNHYSEWARARHAIAVYTLGQLAAPLLAAALSLAGAVAFGGDPAVVLGAMALGQGAALLAVMALLRTPLPARAFDMGILKAAWRYGLPLVASGVLLWVATNVARLAVQYALGADMVGTFSAGWGIGLRLAGVLSMLCTAAAFPLAVQRLESGDRDGAARQVSLNMALMAGLLIPAVVGVAFLSPALALLFIAEPFRAATAVILPIATLTAALRALRIHTGDQMGLLLERTGTMMAFNAADAALSVALTGIGVAVGGMVGAAVGTLAAAAFALAASSLYIVRRLSFRPATGALVRIGAATATMALVLVIAPQPRDVPHLLALIALCVVAYAAMIGLLFQTDARVLRARWA